MRKRFLEMWAASHPMRIAKNRMRCRQVVRILPRVLAERETIMRGVFHFQRTNSLCPEEFSSGPGVGFAARAFPK